MERKGWPGRSRKTNWVILEESYGSVAEAVMALRLVEVNTEVGKGTAVVGIAAEEGSDSMIMLQALKYHWGGP